MQNKIVKNASWIIGVKVFQSIVSLAITMISARYLGPSNYGLISYAESIVAFAIPLLNLGINNVLVQEFINNPNREGKILGTTLGLSAVSSILCYIGVVSFAFVSNPGETETHIVCLLYSVLLLTRAAEVTTYWFQAHYRAKVSSIISFVAYFITALYRLFLLVTGKSVHWFAVSNALDTLIISVALLIMYKKEGGQRLQFSKEEGKRLVKKSHFYILSALMVTIYQQTDKIMIKSMCGVEETGYYSAAVACAVLTNFVFMAIIDSFRPSIFERKKTSEDLFEKGIIDLYSIVFYISILQAIVLSVFSKPIIQLLYGKEYLPARNPLMIISFFVVFSYIGTIRNIWLLAEEKQKYLLWINMCGAAFNVVLNFGLIPVMGISGAALASLITQMICNVGIGWVIKSLRRNNELFIRSINPRHLVISIKTVIRGTHEK